MFRPYRSDIGFIYDHAMRTKDKSNRFSVDIGFGDLVHGGVDLNFTRSYTQSGPWTAQNPLASLVGFKNTDSVFEATYFRNPGEKSVNTKSFYDAVGGDDVVAADIYQPGRGSSLISTTHQLARYKDGRLEGKVLLPSTGVIKKERDKRTQVISYLTAKEASEAGLSKYIENYAVNQYGLRNCDVVEPERELPETGQGLWGQYLNLAWTQEFWTKIDPIIRFQRIQKHAPVYDINVGKPQNGIELGDNFAANWIGVLRVPATGTYAIRDHMDDGMRLYINDQLFIDRWVEQSAGYPNDQTIYVNLVAGEIYKIQVLYYQLRKSYDAWMFWSYNGGSEEIIPQKYLYLTPAPRDSFVNGIVSREKRVNSFRKENHLSEIDVLNADGRRYVYGLPVYNLKQKEATFSVDAAGGNSKEGLVKYTADGDHRDDSTTNTKGVDNYFNSEEVPAYAHSFLLTGILSPDYTDLTGDGISPDDPGDAVKFNYSKVAGINNPYKWRIPYKDSAAYNEGLKTETRDDKGNYVYGEKELWYLNSVESKNMIATFKISDRKDLLPIDRRGVKLTDLAAKKLDEINLYSKADFLKNGTNAVPVKTVHFKYSYSLCRGMNAPVNDSGKLTLDSIWFSYNGN